jgi:hypothetical protein
VAPHAQYDGTVGEGAGVGVGCCFCDLDEARDCECDDYSTQGEDYGETALLSGRDLEFTEEIEGENHNEDVGNNVGAGCELDRDVGATEVFWVATASFACQHGQIGKIQIMCTYSHSSIW